MEREGRLLRGEKLISNKLIKVVCFLLKHSGTSTFGITDDKYNYSQVTGGIEIRCFIRCVGKKTNL